MDRVLAWRLISKYTNNNIYRVTIGFNPPCLSHVNFTQAYEKFQSLSSWSRDLPEYVFIDLVPDCLIIEESVLLTEALRVVGLGK